jgi:outer membrane lipoprotein-sorting protein
MKLLLGFILTFLFLLGCGEKKEDKAPEKNNENSLTVDTTDISTTPSANPNESFRMKYNFVLNKDYKYRIAALTDNIQTMKADTTISQHANQSIIYLLNLKPVEIDNDSATEFICTFYSVKVEANVNDQTFTYQSGVTTDSLEKTKYAEYDAIVNNPFNIRVNKIGEVVDIFKMDKILTKFLALKSISDSLNSAEKSRVKEQITQGGIKPLISQVFRKIPEKLFAKDSIWTYQQPVSNLLVFQVNSTNIYKINSLENFNKDRVAVIDASLETKISGDNKATENGFTYKFNKPETEASGKIYFNIDKGYIQKSRVKTKIVISYTMEGNTPEGKKKGSRYEVVENTNIIELL